MRDRGGGGVTRSADGAVARALDLASREPRRQGVSRGSIAGTAAAGPPSELKSRFAERGSRQRRRLNSPPPERFLRDVAGNCGGLGYATVHYRMRRHQDFFSATSPAYPG